MSCVHWDTWQIPVYPWVVEDPAIVPSALTADELTHAHLAVKLESCYKCT